MAKKLGLEVCIAFIVFVTAVDIFWCAFFDAATLLENEKNPIASAIIVAGEKSGLDGVALLCGLKVVTTFVVVGVCRLLYSRSKKIGAAVTIGVAVFQLCLLYYLNYGGS